eukprot:5814284-Prymnesium_polylepis.1
MAGGRAQVGPRATRGAAPAGTAGGAEDHLRVAWRGARGLRARRALVPGRRCHARRRGEASARGGAVQ